MTLAPCDPCGTFTRQLGPYFLPVDRQATTLYAHYQCRACGRTRIPFAKNPAGREVVLSYVEPKRVHR